MSMEPQSPTRVDVSVETQRETERLRNVAQGILGIRVVSIEPMAAGLGTRRFYRLALAGAPGSAIARVEVPEDPAGRPEGVAAEPPLEPIRAQLEASGLPVPAALGAAPECGLLLLEDLGRRSLFDALGGAGPDTASGWLRQALGLIPQLQRIAPQPGVAAFERRLDAPLFAYKAQLFAAHALPRMLGRPARPAEREVVAQAFDWVAELAAAAPQRLAHRDFQSQNLMLRADGSLAMIDLQGAFLAPPEYDPVCLLRDSYLGLTTDQVDELAAWLRPQLPDAPDAASFALRFAALTLTRKGKDLARFLYASSQRGDPRFERYVEGTLAMVRSAARSLAPQASVAERLWDLIGSEPAGCAP
jgi:aminoglycoside/choline kinase family phosphotransferase